MRAQEAIFSGNNPVAGPTSINLTLLGGRYSLDYKATIYGTVTFTKLAQDGVTAISLLPASSANTSVLIDLPPGTYQITLDASVTGFVYSIARVPLEN